MFFNVLLLQFACSITGDLTPPFYPNTRNRIGYWEISNATRISEESIAFPQNPKGGIWNSLPIPFGEWSFSASFSVGSGGTGGFGVWLIEEHSAFGSFYGGPTQFKGAAFIGYVIGSELRIKCVQSKGDKAFSTYRMNDSYDMAFGIGSSKKRIDVCVHVLEKELVVECMNSSIALPLNTDLSNAWIGITAVSNENDFNIEFLGFKFDEEEYVAKHRGDKQQSGIPKFYQRKNGNFRNMHFQIMSKELDAFHEKATEEKDVFNVLDSIDEFTHALEDVETYNELNTFIRKTLIPYAQGWQRRTFKIVENSQKTKELMSHSFNQTRGLLYIFNNSIHESVSKTDRKINLLTEVINDNYSDLTNMFLAAQPKESSFLVYAKYISIVEVLLIICFYVALKIPSFREALRILA